MISLYFLPSVPAPMIVRCNEELEGLRANEKNSLREFLNTEGWGLSALSSGTSMTTDPNSPVEDISVNQLH